MGSRYLRPVGALAFGFSPMRRTQVLLPDHGERLQRSMLLEVIALFQAVLRHMSESVMPCRPPAIMSQWRALCMSA